MYEVTVWMRHITVMLLQNLILLHLWRNRYRNCFFMWGDPHSVLSSAYFIFSTRSLVHFTCKADQSISILTLSDCAVCVTLVGTTSCFLSADPSHFLLSSSRCGSSLWEPCCQEEVDFIRDTKLWKRSSRLRVHLEGSVLECFTVHTSFHTTSFCNTGWSI